MFDLRNIFSPDKKKAALSKAAVAELLKTSPEALEAFERAYAAQALNYTNVSDNLFEINAKQASELRSHEAEVTDVADTRKVDSLVSRIVDELLTQTPVYRYVNQQGCDWTVPELPESLTISRVDRAEIAALPKSLRPQLTGHLMMKDINEDSYPTLLWMY